jgi:hypothetical protein
LVPVETIRSCVAYFQLPKLLINLGTTAKGLEREYVRSGNAAGLAQCVGSDIVMVVSAKPQVQVITQMLGMGTSLVTMPTVVHGFDNTGNEIWVDYLSTKSDTVQHFNGKLITPDAATAQAK